MPRRPTLRGDARGMTLIEVMIALLIVAGLFALVMPSVQAMAGVKVKEEAGRLSGAIRYLYDHTAITGETCRLHFTLSGDKDNGGYAAECTKGPPRLAAGQTDVRDGARDVQDDSPFADRKPETDEEKFQAGIEQKAAWSQFATSTVQPVKLPENVHLVGVWTGRVTQTVTKGDAFLYFFPMGETQKAYVFLEDDDHHDYTLTVQGLTGRTIVHVGKLEVPRD